MCCPVAVASGAEGPDSTADDGSLPPRVTRRTKKETLRGEGSMATQNCCGPDGACDDGDPCTEDDHCNGNPNYCSSMPAFTCCGRAKVCADDGDVCTLEQCVGGACVTTDRNCYDGFRCTIDGCDPVTGCSHTNKDCNDTDPCTFDSCDPFTGDCTHAQNCHDPARPKCCPDGSGSYCCTSSDGTCCGNPSHCCDSGKTCCPGGLECCASEQTCCNGSCGLKGACCKFDTGSCSEQTQSCCVQQGGTYQGDRTSCDLCKPKCDNCQSFTRNFAECKHFQSDPIGTPCSTTECIENQMDTASCTRHPNRIGPAKCDTRILPSEVFGRQWVRAMTCPAQNVTRTPFFTQSDGCGEDCTTSPPNWDSCLVDACTGVLLRGPFERYGKGVCGCGSP